MSNDLFFMTDPSDDLSDRLAALSPTKRSLLEARLKKKRSDTSRSQPIARRATGEQAPLSFGQQRLWFLNQFHPGNPAYNVSAAFRLQGPLNIAVLKRSLNEIIRRHEVLRTTFPTVNGEPVALIARRLTLSITKVNIQQLPESERETKIRQLASEETQRPFDLTRGPLFRVKLLCLGDHEHILLLTMHHIITDVWSREVLYRELSTLYEAFLEGKPSPLSDLPIQYADYALWQRESMQSQAMEELLSFWIQQLSGSLPVLELSTDRPRPAVQTFRGAKHFLIFPRNLYNSLKALSHREGCTLFMTLLAAFQALLFRYTHREDILVGSPIANRNRPEIEGLIGFFLNTLVLRTDLSGNPSFRELLGRVREVTLGAYAHQDLPFEKLVKSLPLERDISRNPIFQVMFTISPTEILELPFLSVSTLDFDSGTAQFDLTARLHEGPEGLGGHFEYNSDLFDSSTIDRMAGHFQNLLHGVVSNPQQRISDMPILSKAENHQLLVEWNDTQASYPEDVCLHELFEAQVQRTPDITAVVFKDQRLTYLELNRRANQLAHHLQTLGVRPEDLVGIFMERSLEMIVGLYGILKAGGAYVPLDPEYPPERVAFMLQDTRVPVLLTQKDLVTSIPEHSAKVICLDSDWAAIAEESADNVVSEVTSVNLAYVIYTSGSTGRPKGVMNTHRGICNRLLWMQDAFQLTQEDRVLQKTPFSFDVSVWEFFWPLLVGARLVVARPGGHKDPCYLIEVIEEQRITTLHFVPSMLQIFLEDKGVKRCHSLNRVICSGEALPYELQERFFEILDAELHNLYGPTEAAVDVTYWACQQESKHRIVPIGRPVANTQIYVLDQYIQPVPIGVPGELHIGGVQVARGYLNRPKLNAEKFIPDPFSRKPGARLYKTGDLACYLPDGEIKYLGRIDHQVKIRGVRIELGEIESVLEGHPDIRQAVVIASEDEPRNKRLVAYVVTRAGQPIAIRPLRSYLQDKLPDSMIPAAFVMLDSMPLTPNGKVDRRALPAPDMERPELDQPYVSPRTELERRLVSIWCELLRLDRVGIHDRFFELGGNSIQAAQFINRVQEELGVNIHIVSIFEAPSIAEYAAFLKEEHGDAVAKKFGLDNCLGLEAQVARTSADNDVYTSRRQSAHDRRKLREQQRQRRQQHRNGGLRDNTT